MSDLDVDCVVGIDTGVEPCTYQRILNENVTERELRSKVNNIEHEVETDNLLD